MSSNSTFSPSLPNFTHILYPYQATTTPFLQADTQSLLLLLFQTFITLTENCSVGQCLHKIDQRPSFQILPSRWPKPPQSANASPHPPATLWMGNTQKAVQIPTAVSILQQPSTHLRSSLSKLCRFSTFSANVSDPSCQHTLHINSISFLLWDMMHHGPGRTQDGRYILEISPSTSHSSFNCLLHSSSCTKCVKQIAKL